MHQPGICATCQFCDGVSTLFVTFVQCTMVYCGKVVMTTFSLLFFAQEKNVTE